MNGRKWIALPLVLIWTILAEAGLPKAAAQQESPPVAVISDDATCPDCRMSARLMFTLQQGQGAPQLTRAPKLVVDSRGYIVATRVGAGAPAIYNPSGRFVGLVGSERAVASGGSSADVLIPGDGVLYAIDSSARQLSLFGEDWRFGRSAPMPAGVYSAVQTRDGTLIINASVHDPELFGKPYHAFDAVGNYLSSFGESRAALIPGRTQSTVRKLLAAQEGGAWAMPPFAFEIERWLPDGTLAEAFSRDAALWQNEGMPRTFLSEAGPPTPQVVALEQDTSGRLWIAYAVTDERWESAVDWDRWREGEAAIGTIVEDWDRLVDTMVEVIDVRSGNLVASERFDQRWTGFVGPGRLQRFHVDDSGHTTVEIHELLLLESGRR